jgi:hypothetical protein
MEPFQKMPFMLTPNIVSWLAISHAKNPQIKEQKVVIELKRGFLKDLSRRVLVYYSAKVLLQLGERIIEVKK